MCKYSTIITNWIFRPSNLRCGFRSWQGFLEISWPVMHAGDEAAGRSRPTWQSNRPVCLSALLCTVQKSSWHCESASATGEIPATFEGTGNSKSDRRPSATIGADHVMVAIFLKWLVVIYGFVWNLIRGLESLSAS